MLNLNEITAVMEAHASNPNECWIERKERTTKLLSWLPALVKELRAARAEIERLRALVPLPGLLRRLAGDADKRADCFANTAPGVAQLCRADDEAARTLAQRIEKEANDGVSKM